MYKKQKKIIIFQKSVDKKSNIYYNFIVVIKPRQKNLFIKVVFFMRIIFKGKEIETSKVLRGGDLFDTEGNLLISKDEFIKRLTKAIDEKTKHGVRRFSFSYEEKKEKKVYCYELTTKEIKNNLLNLFSYNATKDKVLTITFRPTKSEKDFLKANFTPFDIIDKNEITAIGTSNNGINAEILLSGHFHKSTFSDGVINGKRSELKVSTVNNSNSLSKTSDFVKFIDLLY